MFELLDKLRLEIVELVGDNILISDYGFSGVRFVSVDNSYSHCVCIYIWEDGHISLTCGILKTEEGETYVHHIDSCQLGDLTDPGSVDTVVGLLKVMRN